MYAELIFDTNIEIMYIMFRYIQSYTYMYMHIQLTSVYLDTLGTGIQCKKCNNVYYLELSSMIS